MSDKKKKQKEKRCLMHVINTCIKYNIGFQLYEHGSFYVTDFCYSTGSFLFREESMDAYSQTIFELRDKLDAYLKRKHI